jgi:hypothetical protein
MPPRNATCRDLYRGFEFKRLTGRRPFKSFGVEGLNWDIGRKGNIASNKECKNRWNVRHLISYAMGGLQDNNGDGRKFISMLYLKSMLTL